MARALFRFNSMSNTRGCAAPSKRREVRSMSSDISTASRRSSSVAPSSSVVRAHLDRGRDGLLVFFVGVILFRVAAAGARTPTHRRVSQTHRATRRRRTRTRRRARRRSRRRPPRPTRRRARRRPSRRRRRWPRRGDSSAAGSCGSSADLITPSPSSLLVIDKTSAGAVVSITTPRP